MGNNENQAVTITLIIIITMATTLVAALAVYIFFLSGNKRTLATDDTSVSSEIRIPLPRSSETSSIASTPAKKTKSSVISVPPSMSSKQSSSSESSGLTYDQKTEQWFCEAFYNESVKVLGEIDNATAKYDSKITDVNQKTGELVIQKSREISALTEECSNMGLLHSGYYNSRLSAIDEKYRDLKATYDEQVAELVAERDAEKQEMIDNFLNNVLSKMKTTHHLTSNQVIDYYNLYGEKALDYTNEKLNG